VLLILQASGPELIGGTSGESEQRIREIFAAAVASSPSILFLDALDVIAAKRDVSHRKEGRKEGRREGEKEGKGGRKEGRKERRRERRKEE